MGRLFLALASGDRTVRIVSHFDQLWAIKASQMTLSRAADGCLCPTARRWLVVLLAAVSLELCISSTSYAGATTLTVTERASASVVSPVSNSKAGSSPVPSWVVIEEEAHSGKEARRLLLLKPTEELPCSGVLKLQKTADGRSVLRPPRCRLLRGTDGDTALCQILGSAKASRFEEGDQFVCSGASSTTAENPAPRQQCSAP